MKRFLVAIVGPTAVGKTSLSIDLAKIFNSEIISADSRQIYKELEIGTAKPSQGELEAIPHHFINSHSIHDDFDVGQYERDALNLIEERFENHNVLFLVGGSGLYVDALSYGLDDLPSVDKEIRKRLNRQYEEQGLDSLLDQLKTLDPDYYGVVDQNNPQRIIRALEVGVSTGKPFSSFRKKKAVVRPFEMIRVGLEIDRSELYERIDRRVDAMIEEGLIEEARGVLEYEHLNALQTVGYRELFPFFQDEYDKEEAVRLLKRNSRRYAKRQLTWFKKNSETTWFHPTQKDEIEKFIRSEISKRSEAKK